MLVESSATLSSLSAQVALSASDSREATPITTRAQEIARSFSETKAAFQALNKGDRSQATRRLQTACAINYYNHTAHLAIGILLFQDASEETSWDLKRQSLTLAAHYLTISAANGNNDPILKLYQAKIQKQIAKDPNLSNDQQTANFRSAKTLFLKLTVNPDNRIAIDANLEIGNIYLATRQPGMAERYFQSADDRVNKLLVSPDLTETQIKTIQFRTRIKLADARRFQVNPYKLAQAIEDYEAINKQVELLFLGLR